jgi:hypothetical protein
LKNVEVVGFIVPPMKDFEQLFVRTNEVKETPPSRAAPRNVVATRLAQPYDQQISTMSASLAPECNEVKE